MGQKFAAYDATGAILAFYDSVDSPPPGGVTVLEIADSEWQTCISTPGYTVRAGALVAPAPPTASELLTQAQATQIATLDAACKTAIYSGFVSSALGAAHKYPALDTDQQNLSASVLASLMPGIGSGWTTPFWCCDSAGSWAYVEHSAAQIQQVGQDGKAAILTAIAKKVQLAAQVSTAATIDAVRAVVWS